MFSLNRLALHAARMEPLLAELLASKQLTLDGIVFRAKGLFSRAYSRDVAQVETGENKQTKQKGEDVVYVDVWREGFYDALPEFLFHEPEETSGYKHLDQRLKESKKVKEQEEEARLFFRPFEQEFFRYRVELELEERRLLSEFSNPIHQAIYYRFWGDVWDLRADEEAVLFSLLPLAYKIAGRRDQMAACFATVLSDPVRLEDAPGCTTNLGDFDLPDLGTCILGVDMALGGTFEEELPDLMMHIGPIDLAALPDYLEGGRKKQLLDLLCRCFVPAEMEVETQISIRQPEEGFVLNEDKGTAWLGYSTFI